MWQEYLGGHQKPIVDLIRAWHGIQELSKKDPDNEHSFFKIGGFHGEPFRGAGYANGSVSPIILWLLLPFLAIFFFTFIKSWYPS
jgi:hypothetical protein